MNRRLLAALVAASALGAAACGAAPAPSSAPAPTTSTAPTATAPSADDSGDSGSRAGAGGGSRSTERSSSTDLDAVQDEADRVLNDLFEADRDLDYRAIEHLTSRAVAARYRNQELLATVEGLDPSFTTPEAASVTVTSDVEVLEPEGGAVATTGAVTATYTDDDGAETSYTYTDIVFEQDGDDLLVADWRSDTEALPASSAFLNVAGVAPGTAGDLTVRLEPGYRDPDGDPAFVEYLFTVTNDDDVAVDVQSVELTTPDGETYQVQFGTAGTAEPGETASARVGFEGPSVPVSGGTLTITLEDEDGGRSIVLVDVPAFDDTDGDPEPPRPIVLDDVEPSASGTLGASGPT